MYVFDRNETEWELRMNMRARVSDWERKKCKEAQIIRITLKHHFDSSRSDCLIAIEYQNRHFKNFIKIEDI